MSHSKSPSDQSSAHALGSFKVRAPTEADYPNVCTALEAWWDVPGIENMGAQRRGMLQRLFFVHFADTSFLVEDADGQLVAFLIGFLSPSRPREAYIHFVGVTPSLRQRGVARALYERFFDLVRRHDCSEVHCVTSPANTRSVEFHRRMGFEVLGPVADYDGPGVDRFVFVRSL